MPISISVTLTISTTAPPSMVWAALEAAPRWREVLDGLASARIEPDGMLRAGAVMRSFAKPGSAAADMAYRVVAARRPRHLAIEAEVGHYRSRAVYDIEALPDGAQVTLTAEIVPTRGLDRIIAFLARRRYIGKFRAETRKRLRGLMTLAERIATERDD
jgi:hypothetical protein